MILVASAVVAGTAAGATGPAVGSAAFLTTRQSPNGGFAEQVPDLGEEVGLRVDAVLRAELEEFRTDRRDEVDVDRRLPLAVTVERDGVAELVRAGRLRLHRGSRRVHQAGELPEGC